MKNYECMTLERKKLATSELPYPSIPTSIIAYKLTFVKSSMKSPVKGTYYVFFLNKPYLKVYSYLCSRGGLLTI